MNISTHDDAVLRYSLIRWNISYVLCFGDFCIIYNSADTVTSGIFIWLTLIIMNQLAIIVIRAQNWKKQYFYLCQSNIRRYFEKKKEQYTWFKHVQDLNWYNLLHTDSKFWNKGKNSKKERWEMIQNVSWHVKI